MTWPLIQFVDGPSPDAHVRYDLNDADADAPRRVGDDFTLGAPTLDSAPDAVGAVWGLRAPAFTQRIKGPKAAAMEALSALSRELLRPTNWVHVKLDQMAPSLWLKTYRTASQPLSLARVYVGTDDGDPVELPDTWEIPISLVADAFAYGERVTIPSATLSNALDADNPMRLVLPPIKGDAPTALRVRISPASDGPDGCRIATFGIGCIAADGDLTDSIIDIGLGDGWTAGEGTGDPIPDIAFLGGSYRLVEITGGENEPYRLTTRATGIVFDVLPGRYKVFLRCELDTKSTNEEQSYSLAFAQSANGILWPGPTVFQESSTGASYVDANEDPVEVPSYPFQGWIDLGEFTFPLGITIPDDLTEATQPINALVGILAGTTDDAESQIWLDALKLVPVDGPRIRSATWMCSSFEGEATDVVIGTSPLSATTWCSWDGDEELAWMGSQMEEFLLQGAPRLKGGFPVADPAAAQNLLVAFPLTRGRSEEDDAGTAVDATWGVEVSYHPRLLHLGDGS